MHKNLMCTAHAAKHPRENPGRCCLPWFWCKEEPLWLMGCNGPSRRGRVAGWSLPLQTCAPASLTNSFLWGRVGVNLVFGGQRSWGSCWKLVFYLQLCLMTYLGAIAVLGVVWNGLAGPETSPGYLSESYGMCVGLACISQQRYSVAALHGTSCEPPGLHEARLAWKNWSWTAVMPNSTTRIPVLCPLSLLYFCSIPEHRVAGGDNAAGLILCLCTLLLCLCTQIVCVASERCRMFGSCCLTVKGVMLLIEVSCTGICAYTQHNTCTLIFSSCVRPAAHMLQK